MNRFKTEVEIDHEEFGEGKAEVEWDCEFELRTWGVKSIYPTVYPQTIKVVLTKEVETGDDSEYIEKDCEFNLEGIETNGFDDALGHTIRPETLVFADGKWTLEFA